MLRFNGGAAEKSALESTCWSNPNSPEHIFREKKAHKHKLFALVNVQMALGQTGGCPRVNRAKKFMRSPRNTGNINFSLRSTGGLSQGCPDFQKVYAFKVYVPFSCPNIGEHTIRGRQLSHRVSTLVAQIARCNRDVRCDSNRTPPNR